MNEDLVVCPSCKGMGTIKAIHDNSFRRIIRIEQCRLCNGRGQVERQRAYNFADRTRGRASFGTSMTVGGL